MATDLLANVIEQPTEIKHFINLHLLYGSSMCSMSLKKFFHLQLEGLTENLKIIA